MSPDNLGPFYEWEDRENPPYSLGVAIRAWIDRLDQAPWQLPSIPIPEMTVEGEYQTRIATVLGVDIFYQEHYSSRKIALTYLGTRPS